MGVLAAIKKIDNLRREDEPLGEGIIERVFLYEIRFSNRW